MAGGTAAATMALGSRADAETEQDSTGLLQELYRRHAAAVVARLYRQCGDVELARDLTQDAFVVAMRRAEAGEAPLNGAEGTATWVHAVAYNLLRDHRRSGARRRRLWSRWFDSGRSNSAELSGEGPQAGDPMVARLDAALRELNHDQRDAFVLRVVEGLSLEAAAQALGTTVQTVSYRAKRAERIVREHFDQGGTTT